MCMHRQACGLFHLDGCAFILSTGRFYNDRMQGVDGATRPTLARGFKKAPLHPQMCIRTHSNIIIF
jgi:hypothetical protein